MSYDDAVFESLLARRMLLVGLPMLVVAAIAWLVVGVWAMLVVIVIAAAAMTFRGMTILRRAHR